MRVLVSGSIGMAGSVLIPSMYETYSLSHTVDIITQTCRPENIAKIIIIISPQKFSYDTVKTALYAITGS